MTQPTGTQALLDPNPTEVPQKLADLAARSERERKRFYARQPKAAKDVLASVIAKRGYAASKGAGALQAAWQGVAKQVLAEEALAKMTRAKGLMRGKLEVLVANHVVMQEINFHRPTLLAAIQEAQPDARISDLRFKVGRLT